MRVKSLLVQLSALLLIFVAVGMPLTEGISLAATPGICRIPNELGRAGCYGYFSGNYEYSNNTGIQGGNILDCTQPGTHGCQNGESQNNEIPWPQVRDANSFTDLIGSYLSKGYSYNSAGAAFIIDAMLGKKGSDFTGVDDGIRYAIANFNYWKALVDYYDAAKQVDWHLTGSKATIPVGEPNSMHACIPNTANPCWPESVVAANDSRDFAFYADNVPGGEVSELIVFYNPDGSKFEIRRECANLVGDLGPLQPPIPKPKCAGASVTPPALDPKTQYTVNGSVTYQNSAVAGLVVAAGGQFFINISGPKVSSNNANQPITQNGSALNASVTPGATNSTGQYSISYGISGSYGAITCSGSFNITYDPYFTTSGDVSAGEGMSAGGTPCAVSPDKNGGIVSWNRDGGKKGNDFSGAGTHYAAFALSHLQDFVSTQGIGQPDSQSFANTKDGDINFGQGLFGGYFGGNPYSGNGLSCTHDYFTGATNIKTGNITIGGQMVNNGTSTVMYVQGNVYITGNIVFKGSQAGQSYANIGQIPAFDVVVEPNPKSPKTTGNIYISPNVTQLDGLYVAEPTVIAKKPYGGIIYTCSSGPFKAQGLNKSLYNNCSSNALTFNGAVVARQVWLLRAAGSISTTPSEMMNFTPEAWLATPPDAVSGSGGAGEFDAVTSLPPVL